MPDKVKKQVMDKMAEENDKNKEWESLKSLKRFEIIYRMKKNGITYNQADHAFLDMMGEIEEEET